MSNDNQHAWIEQIFQSQQADNQGIVRRSIEDVEKYASFQLLFAAVRDREFHLLESGGQYIIICNSNCLLIHT